MDPNVAVEGCYKEDGRERGGGVFSGRYFQTNRKIQGNDIPSNERHERLTKAARLQTSISSRPVSFFSNRHKNPMELINGVAK